MKSSSSERRNEGRGTPVGLGFSIAMKAIWKSYLCNGDPTGPPAHTLELRAILRASCSADL